MHCPDMHYPTLFQQICEYKYRSNYTEEASAWNLNILSKLKENLLHPYLIFPDQ